MATYGTSTNYVGAISSAQSGGSPSGNIFYFTAKFVNGKENWDMGIKHAANNIHIASKKSEYTPRIALSELYIIDDGGGNTLTEQFNDILGFLRGLNDFGANPAYLWVRNISSGTAKNVDLGYLGETTTDYLQGFPTKINWEQKGVIQYIKQIEWEGVNT